MLFNALALVSFLASVSASPVAQNVRKPPDEIVPLGDFNPWVVYNFTGNCDGSDPRYCRYEFKIKGEQIKGPPGVHVPGFRAICGVISTLKDVGPTMGCLFQDDDFPNLVGGKTSRGLDVRLYTGRKKNDHPDDVLMAFTYQFVELGKPPGQANTYNLSGEYDQAPFGAPGTNTFTIKPFAFHIVNPGE